MHHPSRADGRARRERRQSSEQRLRRRTRGLTHVPWCDPPGRYSATRGVTALAARLTFVGPSGSISPLETSPIGRRRRARKDENAMATLLTERGEFDVPTARSSGEDLWLSTRDAAESTGWLLKPEGLCKDEICVPLPPGREREFVHGQEVNVAALWRHLAQPLVHS